MIARDLWAGFKNHFLLQLKECGKQLNVVSFNCKDHETFAFLKSLSQIGGGRYACLICVYSYIMKLESAREFHFFQFKHSILMKYRAASYS